MVTGVGDEVLLFATFFLLSLVMVVLLSRLRPRERGRRGREGGRGDVQQQQQPRMEDEGGPTGSPLTDQGGHGQPQIRPRRGNAATGDSTPSSSEARLSVRLVLSGLAQGTKTVTLRPDCSLFQLKRYPHNRTRLNIIAVAYIAHPLSPVLHPSLNREHFQEQLSQNLTVRFILQGQVLEDEAQTLEQLGIENRAALHVYVSQPRQAQQEAQGEMVNFDLSHLFLPLIGLMLAVVWVLLMCFPQVFSLPTKLLLFLLSLGYVFLAYNSTQA